VQEDARDIFKEAGASVLSTAVTDSRGGVCIVSPTPGRDIDIVEGLVPEGERASELYSTLAMHA
jgi:hypothetical protein